MKKLISILSILFIAGCNSVYVKPNTLDVNKSFYADRGGYGMRKSIKQKMEERGYTVVVGKAQTSRNFTDNNESIEIDYSAIPTDVKYVVKVNERKEWFNPFWCALNGFWWWNFNVSIADQKTGEEIMTWRGRACQDSALRMLDDILDEMEDENAGNK